MDGETQMLVSSIDYNEYVGRIGIGRIERGSLKVGQPVTVCDYHGNVKPYNSKIVSLYAIEGLVRTPVEEMKAGDIVCFSGIENITIGETLCAYGQAEPLPFVKISEPTVEMYFSVNDSPFAAARASSSPRAICATACLRSCSRMFPCAYPKPIPPILSVWPAAARCICPS